MYPVAGRRSVEELRMGHAPQDYSPHAKVFGNKAMKACHTDQTWGNTKVCEMIQVAIPAQELSNGSSVKIAIEVNCHFRMPLSCNDNSCAM